MSYTPLAPVVVRAAQTRIAPYIHRTPVLSSSLLNAWLGHEILMNYHGLKRRVVSDASFGIVA
jgi:threonine dehydratase